MVRIEVRLPSRPVVFLVFVRVGDVVEDVAPLARAPGVGGGVRHPGIGIVVENPGIRPVKAGLDGAVIPHHLQGELPPSGGGGGGVFVFVFVFVLVPTGKAIPPRPGSGARRSDQGAEQTRRGGGGGGDAVGHLRVPPRQRASRATHGREPTRRLERRRGKPRVADNRGALADAAAAARREQSNARGASPRGDGGAEAPPNATENPAAAGLGVTVTSVTSVTSRRRRIQRRGSIRKLPKVTRDVGNERCERSRRDVPVEVPPTPSPQETGERGGRERRRPRPFPFLGDGDVTPARWIREWIREWIRGQIYRRGFVARVG